MPEVKKYSLARDGAVKLSPHFEDLTNMRFGRLRVIERTTNSPCGTVRWLCECDCGAITKPSGQSLKSGITKSCGCMHKEIIARNSTKHGDSKTRLYKLWTGLISRCYNKQNASYLRYGGRNIAVCDEWLYDYLAFRTWAVKHGYRNNLTIDRINNDGNYSPDNCRWANHVTQNNNTNRNRRLTYDGRTQTLAQWAAEYGVPYNRLYTRIYRGWDIERALLKGA